MSGVAAGGAVEAEPATDDVPEKKPNIITRGLNTLASCVTPGLYAIVAGGMIKGVVSLLTAIGLISSKSDIITVLNAVAMHPSTYAVHYRLRSSKAVQGQGDLRHHDCRYPDVLHLPLAERRHHRLCLWPINIPAYNYILSSRLFCRCGSSPSFSISSTSICPKSAHRLFRCAVLPDFCTAVPGFAAPLGNWIAKGMTGGFAWLFTHAGPFAGALFCGIIPLTIIFGIKAGLP